MLKASKQILDEIMLMGRAYVNPAKAQQKAALVELEGFLNIDKRISSTWICTLRLSHSAIEYSRTVNQG